MILILYQQQNYQYQAPVSSTTIQSKLYALQCLSGAIEGTSIVFAKKDNMTTTGSTGNTSNNSSSSTSTCTIISLSVINLVGTFLLQYCGPIKISDTSNDTHDNIEDQISDESIRGLNLLIQLVSLQVQQQQQEDQTSINEIIRLVLLFGQNGIEK
jgi:hypothetical protein